MTNTQSVIETHQLTKIYAGRRSGVKALDALTLNVHQGEVFGYLGPNGAGKTTTIRILLDLIRPTSGTARIYGQDVRAHSVAIRRRIGYLPGELSLWDNQTADEIVRYFGRARGGVDQRYVAELAERLEFDLTKKMRQYSTGNKRKLGLILALMHKPELLILDEPTSGLDPLMQQIFIQMIEEIRQEGRTVFLSSHVLSEVQAVCDRVAILREGRLQTVDSVTALTKVDFRWVTLRLREPVPSALVSNLPGVQDVKADGSTLQLRLQGDFDPLLRTIGDRYVVDIHTQDASLEEIFLTYYGDAPNGRNRKQNDPQKAVLR
jgi:ABC-2 type transport system ATP-binding protein